MKILQLPLFLFLMFLSIIGCDYVAITPPPLPETLNLTPPSPDIPAEIAAFVGIWEGKWGATQDTIIVIDKIDNQKADIIFSQAKHKKDEIGFVGEAAYRYYTVSVLPGPILEWHSDLKPTSNPEGYYQCPCKFTLEFSKEKDFLIAYWEHTESKYKIRADLRRRK